MADNATYPLWVYGPTGRLMSGPLQSNLQQKTDGTWWPVDVVVDTISNPVPLATATSNAVQLPPTAPLPPYVVPFFQSPISITVRILVRATPVPVQYGLQIRINVLPAVPVFATDTVTYPTSLHITPIAIPATDSILAILRDKLRGKIDSFYDADRATKTLLNFGNDYQALMTNWQYDPRDPNRATILAKLYRPLPDEVTTKTQAWITREVAPTLIDRLHTIFIPDAPTLQYLRPANKNIDVAGRSGHGVSNVTTQTLFSSSLFDVVSPTDPVLQEWFTFDVNSTELNVDYSDYRNFVFFSSAERRLLAFNEKMATVENLTDVLALHSASLMGTGSANITGSTVYTAIQNLASQRLDTIRSFDGYERFLYYRTGIPYSASLTTDDYQDAFYFHDDATWPKTGNTNVTTTQAASWLADQIAIAREYDRFNQDRLANNLPEYLRTDTNSAEFLTFMDMIGHQVDLMKLYIDQMSLIFDRGSDASIGLSQDVTWNVAESFGIELPNQYAIKNLVDYTIGEVAATDTTTYRTVAAETWKRFLHNHIFLMKTKGTKTSLRALSNTYGILPSAIQIRETTTPGFSYLTGSYEVYEEQTNALSFTGVEYVKLPWNTGSVVPQTLEMRFATTTAANAVLANATNNAWSVVLKKLDDTYARVEVYNALNATIVSSSYLELLDGEYFTAMLRNDTTGLTLAVKRAYQDDLIDESVTTAASGAIAWATPTSLYIAGSGSVSGSAKFIGTIDEVRTWSDLLTTPVFDLHVRYPGMYNGNTTSSAKTALLTRLSFNIPRNLGITGSLVNESPYARTTGVPVLLTMPAVGFPNVASAPYNMVTVTREVQRFAPNAGGSQFTTNKVTIADPPVLQYMTFASSSAQVPVLSRTKSIVTLQDKQTTSKAINTVGFYFSLTDAINDNIIRSIGNIDLQNLIGDPADQYATSYSALQSLSDLYWTSYAYDYNATSFIDFVKNLLDPLFKQARTLLPVRAKMLGGIVHEPHILERSKAPLRPLRVYTNDYDVTVGVVGDMVSSTGAVTDQLTVLHMTASYVPVATYADLASTITTSDVFTTQASITQYTSSIATLDTLIPYAESNTYTAPAIDTTEVFSLVSALSIYNDYTNVLAVKQSLLSGYGVTSELQLTAAQLAAFNQSFLAYQNANVISIPEILEAAKSRANAYLPTGSFVVDTILPYTNFEKIESYTYFRHPLGYVATTEYVQQRRKESSLTSRGAWTTGSVYTRDDYVTTTTNGTTTEWVCTTNNTTITSVLPPAFDTNNWTQMQYITVPTRVMKKVVDINGTISIAPTGSSYPGVVGYHATHYRFTRDTRLGTLRHCWLGCKQTDDTTPNGKPVVEILASAGDILVVNNPGEPIQPTDNTSGPILSVE